MPALTVEELQIVIRVLNEASPELEKISRQLQRLEKASVAPSKGLTRTSRSIRETRRETDRLYRSTRRLERGWLNIKWSQIHRGFNRLHDILMNTQRSFITLQYATEAWLNAIVSGLVAIGGAATAITAQMRDFETAISTATTMFDALSFDKAKNEILDLAEKTGISANEIAEALYMIGSAGYKASDGFEMLRRTLAAAVAGNASPAEVFKGAVSILRTFYKETDDVAGALAKIFALQFQALRKGFFEYREMVRDFGVIVPEAVRLGASFREALAGYAALTLVLGNSAMSATATARAFQDMADKVENFEKAGIELYDKTTGKFVGLLRVLEQLREKTKDMADEQKAAFYESLGLEVRAARGLITWVDRLEEVREIYNYLTGDIKALREAFEKQVETPGWRIARAQQRILVALSKNIDRFADLFEKVVGVVIQGINWLAMNGGQLWDLLMRLLNVIGPIVLKLKIFALFVGDLFQMFFALSHLLHPVNVLFALLGYGLLQVFMKHSDKILKFFKILIGAIVDLINWLWLLATDPKEAWRILKESILKAWDELTDFFQELSKKVGETKIFQVIKRGFEYAGKFFESTKEALQKLAEAIKEGFKGDVDDIIERIKKAIKEGDYITAVGLSIGLAAQLTWKLIKTVYEFLGKTFSVLAHNLADFVKGLIDGFKMADVDKLPRMIEEAWQKGEYGYAVGLAVALGVRWLIGVAEKIWEFAKATYKTITDLAKGIIEGLKGDIKTVIKQIEASFAEGKYAETVGLVVGLLLNVTWQVLKGLGILTLSLFKYLWNRIQDAVGLAASLVEKVPFFAAVTLSTIWLVAKIAEDAFRWFKGVANYVKTNFDRSWSDLASELKKKVEEAGKNRKIDSVEIAGLIILLTLKSGTAVLKWAADVAEEVKKLFIKSGTTSQEMAEAWKEAQEELGEIINDIIAQAKGEKKGAVSLREVTVKLPALTIYLTVAPAVIAFKWLAEEVATAVRIAWNKRVGELKDELVAQLTAFSAQTWKLIGEGWLDVADRHRKEREALEKKLKEQANTLSDEDKKMLEEQIARHLALEERAKVEAQKALDRYAKLSEKSGGITPDLATTIKLTVALVISPVVKTVQVLKMVYDAAKISSLITEQFGEGGTNPALSEIESLVYDELQKLYPTLERGYLPLKVGVVLALTWRAVKVTATKISEALQSFWESPQNDLKAAIEALQKDLDSVAEKAASAAEPETVLSTTKLPVVLLHIPVIIAAGIKTAANIVASIMNTMSDIVLSVSARLSLLLENSTKKTINEMEAKNDKEIQNATQSLQRAMGKMLEALVKSVRASKELLTSIGAALVATLNAALKAAGQVLLELKDVVFGIGAAALSIGGTVYTFKEIGKLIADQIKKAGKASWMVKVGKPLLLVFGGINIAIMVGQLFAKLNQVANEKARQIAEDFRLQLATNLERYYREQGREIQVDVQKLAEYAIPLEVFEQTIKEKVKIAKEETDFFSMLLRSLFTPNAPLQAVTFTVPLYLSFKPQWQAITAGLQTAIENIMVFTQAVLAKISLKRLGYAGDIFNEDAVRSFLRKQGVDEGVSERIAQALARAATSKLPDDLKYALQLGVKESIRRSLGKMAKALYGAVSKMVDAFSKELAPFTLAMSVNIAFTEVALAAAEGDLKTALKKLLENAVIAAFGAGAVSVLTKSPWAFLVTFNIVFSILSTIRRAATPKDLLEEAQRQMEVLQQTLSQETEETSSEFTKEVIKRQVEGVQSLIVRTQQMILEAAARGELDLNKAKEWYQQLQSMYETLIDASKRGPAELASALQETYTTLNKLLDEMTQRIKTQLELMEKYENIINSWYQRTPSGSERAKWTTIYLQSQQQHQTGGFTGYGPPNEPAGIVHKGEYVIPAWMVKKYPELIAWLERRRLRGYAKGGSVGTPAPLIDKGAVEESIDRIGNQIKEFVGAARDLFAVTNDIADLLATLGATATDTAASFDELLGKVKEIPEIVKRLDKLVDETDKLNATAAGLAVATLLINKLLETNMPFLRMLKPVLFAMDRVVSGIGRLIGITDKKLSEMYLKGVNLLLDNVQKALELQAAQLRITEKSNPADVMRQFIRSVDWESIGVQMTERDIENIVQNALAALTSSAEGEGTPEEILQQMIKNGKVAAKEISEKLVEETIKAAREKMAKEIEAAPLKGLITVVGLMADSIFKVAEAFEYASKMIGSISERVEARARKGSNTFAVLSEALGSVIGIALKSAAKLANAFLGLFKVSLDVESISAEMRDTWEELLDLMDETGAALNNFIASIPGVGEALASGLGALESAIRDVITAIIGTTIGGGSEILAFIARTIKEVLGNVGAIFQVFLMGSKNLGKVLNPMMTVFEALADVLMPIIDDALQPFVDLLVAIGKTVGTLLKPALMIVAVGVKTLGYALVSAWNLMRPVIKLIYGVGLVIYNAFATVWNSVADAINTVLGWLGVKVPKMVEYAWEKLGEKIEEDIPELDLGASAEDYTVEQSYTANVTRSGPETVNIYQYIQNSNFFNSEEELKRFIIEAVQEAIEQGVIKV